MDGDNDLSEETAPSTKASVPVSWWPAIGVHLGLLVISASCAYTLQPEGMFSKRQFVAFAALGVVILGAGLLSVGRVAAGTAGKLLLALGAATALALSYDPPLADLPGISARVPEWLAQFEPGIGIAGVAIAFVFWIIYRVVARGGIDAEVPLRGALLLSAALVLALAAIMYLGLHNLYDLEGGYGSLLLTFNVVRYTVLILIALEMAGAVGFGGLAHLYVGTALIIAAGRNLMA